jgi:hypothetical protein
MRKWMPGTAALLLASSLALAAAPATNPAVKDANAGLDALNKSDYAGAVRLLTRAINGGKLNASDRELAYVTRARAYIGQSKNDLALADLDRAAALDSTDKDIDTLRFAAKGIPQGPTLAESLAAIQQDVNAQGSIAYTAAIHDGTKNTDWNEARAIEIGGLSSDAAGCRVNFNFKISRADKVLIDKPFSVALQDIKSVQIVTKADVLNRANNDAGHPEWHAQVTPAVSSVAISVTGGIDEFDFKDGDSASRVANALSRAALLCGGAKDAFNASTSLALVAPAQPAAAPPVPVQAPQGTANIVPSASAQKQEMVTPPAQPPQGPVAAPQPVAEKISPAPAASPADKTQAVTQPQVSAPAASVAPAPSQSANGAQSQVASAPPAEVQATSDLNAKIKAANDAADAKFKAEQDKYQQSQDQYKAAQAAYEAQKKELVDQKASADKAYQQQLDDWRKKVAACNAGDRASCGN